MTYATFRLYNSALNQAKQALANAQTPEQKLKAELWIKKICLAYKKTTEQHNLEMAKNNQRNKL